MINHAFRVLILDRIAYYRKQAGGLEWKRDYEMGAIDALESILEDYIHLAASLDQLDKRAADSGVTDESLAKALGDDS